MSEHVHAWVRRQDADAATTKYRCASCGRWGFGTFKPGRGLVIREHSEATGRKLEDETGEPRRRPAERGHSPFVDSPFSNSCYQDPDR